MFIFTNFLDSLGGFKEVNQRVNSQHNILRISKVVLKFLNSGVIVLFWFLSFLFLEANFLRIVGERQLYLKKKPSCESVIVDKIGNQG